MTEARIILTFPIEAFQARDFRRVFQIHKATPIQVQPVYLCPAVPFHIGRIEHQRVLCDVF